MSSYICNPGNKRKISSYFRAKTISQTWIASDRETFGEFAENPELGTYKINIYHIIHDRRYFQGKYVIKISTAFTVFSFIEQATENLKK